MKKKTVRLAGELGGTLAGFAAATGIQIGILASAATCKSVMGKVTMLTIGTIGNGLACMGITYATNEYIQSLLNLGAKEEKVA